MERGKSKQEYIQFIDTWVAVERNKKLPQSFQMKITQQILQRKNNGDVKDISNYIALPFLFHVMST